MRKSIMVNESVKGSVQDLKAALGFRSDEEVISFLVDHYRSSDHVRMDVIQKHLTTNKKAGV
jgi:hypothetical protein